METPLSLKTQKDEERRVAVLEILNIVIETKKCLGEQRFPLEVHKYISEVGNEKNQGDG